jgi:TonB family protein
VVLDANAPMYEFQVEQQARPVPGTGSPSYPDAMRRAKRGGDVLAQFVVDEHGAVDMSTFKANTSSDPAFTDAVRTALPTMRFHPAMVGGKPVKQVVQQPFTFALPRKQ